MTTKALVCTIAGILATLLMAPPPARAGKLTCLTGTDPSVANDAYQIAYARALIDLFGCFCPNFDGSPGKTNAAYVKCVKQSVDVVIQNGNLRSQCKSTVLKESKAATCGASPSQDKVTCVKKTAGGKVTCAIKPRAQCVDKPGTFTQVACAPVTGACVDAADTNGDGRVAAGDSGACAVPMCGNGVREFLEQCDPPGATCAGGAVCTKSCSCAAPTNTPTPTLRPGQPTNTPAPPPPTNTRTPTPVPGQPTFTFTPIPPTNTFTPVPRFVDNGDGTITDHQTGLMWEKKDQSGGLDDVNNVYVWAGDCSDGSGLCQPDDGAFATCAAATGTAVGCTRCGGTATCNTYGTTTIWHWVNQLRVSGLGGHSDWRIPTVGAEGGAAQLETILDTSVSGCGPPSYASPCVPAAFDTGCTPGCNATGCSCSASNDYWSATTFSADPQDAWGVYFGYSYVVSGSKDSFFLYVRAVR
jgi:hypothetical protein